eukprot:CAMPEP_0202912510 /NCGR_PEP_ID=MMETSP1392-20130828/57941_1 /ASSEMBLY_ACC=CAM_ASM_000868 /TAXON_ID=225041 /ORGANISM="Chlamydomonas chlamydogama, Strain SAG 11-48b" /LENGTH=146 /DNA_ID=CAMNT_0049603439 /DNA_START=512 /DNA_END=953 /DNA_ORIENTATION=+
MTHPAPHSTRVALAPKRPSDKARLGPRPCLWLPGQVHHTILVASPLQPVLPGVQVPHTQNAMHSTSNHFTSIGQQLWREHDVLVGPPPHTCHLGHIPHLKIEPDHRDQHLAIVTQQRPHRRLAAWPDDSCTVKAGQVPHSTAIVIS